MQQITRTLRFRPSAKNLRSIVYIDGLPVKFLTGIYSIASFTAQDAPASSSSSASAGGSTSAVVVDRASGWHVLKIDSYSATKAHGVSKFIRSSTFNVGGHNWYIAYYPDGFDEKTADYIGFSVCLDHPYPHDGVKAQYKLRLLDRAGAPVAHAQYNRTSEMCRFTSSGTNWGYTDFIKRKDLESMYLNDDSFSIRCDLIVVVEIRPESTRVEPLAAPPPPDLHRHLGDLLTMSEKVGGDVTFYVGDKRITAHRNLLAARSTVFMAEFFGPLKEKNTTGVRIEDMDFGVFEAMLHFIYTDTLPKMEKGDRVLMAQHLLVAADRYNLERLKLICEDMLCGYIDVNIAATTLVLAEQHGCQGLKEACFRFLKCTGNLKAVMATDGFQHLKSSCPSLIEELLAVVAPLIRSSSTLKKPRLK